MQVTSSSLSRWLKQFVVSSDIITACVLKCVFVSFNTAGLITFRESKLSLWPECMLTAAETCARSSPRRVREKDKSSCEGGGTTTTPGQSTWGQSVEAVEEVVVTIRIKLASESNSKTPTLVSSYYIFFILHPVQLDLVWTEPDYLFPVNSFMLNQANELLSPASHFIYHTNIMMIISSKSQPEI